MSIESLTYADLSGRLGTSYEAARRLCVVLGYRDRWAMTEQCGSTSILPKSNTSLCPNVHRVVTGRL